MKKLFTVLIIFAFFSTAYAQKEVGQIVLRDGSVIMTYEGSNNEKRIKVLAKKGRLELTRSEFSNMVFAGPKMYYFNQAGEVLEKKISEIDKVIVNAGQYRTTLTDALITEYAIVDAPEVILVPRLIGRGRGKVRFTEIIAQNEKYILYNIFSEGFNRFFITDKEGKTIEKPFSHSLTKKKSSKALEKVKEYFGSCNELIEGMEKNMSTKYGKGIRAMYLLLKTVDADKNGTNMITNMKCN